MKQRLLNFLVALDQLVYVALTLGSGMAHETISGAAESVLLVKTRECD